MPFGVVSGVCREMGMVIVEGEGAVLGVNLRRSIVTNRDDDAHFLPKLLWGRTCNRYHKQSAFAVCKRRNCSTVIEFPVL